MRNAIGGNRRGVTLIEICIALLLLSIGLVSILALFPKALYSTRRAMEISTASSVARGALASLLVYTLNDGNVGDDILWVSGYHGPGASPTAEWWPDAGPEDVKFSSSITALLVKATGTYITVPTIGGWEDHALDIDNDGDCVSWEDGIRNYFFLVTSGRGRGKMCQISQFTGYSLSDEIVVPTIDLERDGVRAGDKFRVVGPGCLPPVSVVQVGDGETMYSWVAVVCENSTISLLDSGTATATGGNWLSDENQVWVEDQFVSDSSKDRSYVLHITGGDGFPQRQQIVSNTKEAIEVSSWDGNPNVDSTYSIYNGSGGMHDVIILVYGRDLKPTGSISQINTCKPVYFFSASIWEPGWVP